MSARAVVDAVDAKNWPPAHVRIDTLKIILVHLPGKGIATFTIVVGANGQSLEKLPSRGGEDPCVLQATITRLWANYCNAGQVGVHHPSMVLITKLPSTGDQEMIAFNSMWNYTEFQKNIGGGLTMRQLDLAVTLNIP